MNESYFVSNWTRIITSSPEKEEEFSFMWGYFTCVVVLHSALTRDKISFFKPLGSGVKTGRRTCSVHSLNLNLTPPTLNSPFEYCLLLSVDMMWACFPRPQLSWVGRWRLREDSFSKRRGRWRKQIMHFGVTLPRPGWTGVESHIPSGLNPGIPVTTCLS